MSKDPLINFSLNILNEYFFNTIFIVGYFSLNFFIKGIKSLLLSIPSKQPITSVILSHKLVFFDFSIELSIISITPPISLNRTNPDAVNLTSLLFL